MEEPSAAVCALLVFAGGGIGATLRWTVALALPQATGGFPWGTFAVNAAGCAAIGAVLHGLDRGAVSEPWRLFVVTGVLGGFTTFSAFGGEVLRMLHEGRGSAALVYATASVACSIGAAVAGHRAAAAVA